MLRIHTDRAFIIGIIDGTLQPVVVSSYPRNVPVEKIFN
jgi:hypothetical protein